MRAESGTMLTLCQCINAHIKPERFVFPSTYITFLGIVIDTKTMKTSILDKCKTLMLKELQSFIAMKNVPNIHYSPSLASSYLPARYPLPDRSFMLPY